MNVYVAPVVEGQTEQRCLERLLHRIWAELLGRPERLQVLEPFRGHRASLVQPDGLKLTESVQKALVKLQAKVRRDPGARPLLFVLLDAEGDCPAQLAPRLLRTARQEASGIAVACVLAKRMFENWIVAGAATLAGVNGLPDPLKPPDKPEDRNGAAWLEQQLRSQKPARRYEKTVDAVIFVRAMDLGECRARSPSFDKLCRDLEAGLPQLPETPPPSQPSTEQTPEPPPA